MDEAERLCDRVAIVDHGKLIALGTPNELIGSLQGANVVEFTSEPLLTEPQLLGIDGIHEHRKRGDAWLIHVDSLAQSVPRLLAVIEAEGSKLISLSTHRATLEDLFVSLTGRDLRDA